MLHSLVWFLKQYYCSRFRCTTQFNGLVTQTYFFFMEVWNILYRSKTHCHKPPKHWNSVHIFFCHFGVINDNTQLKNAQIVNKVATLIYFNYSVLLLHALLYISSQWWETYIVTAINFRLTILLPADVSFLLKVVEKSYVTIHSVLCIDDHMWWNNQTLYRIMHNYITQYLNPCW